jgi:hypothetical protein
MEVPTFLTGGECACARVCVSVFVRVCIHACSIAAAASPPTHPHPPTCSPTNFQLIATTVWTYRYACGHNHSAGEAAHWPPWQAAAVTYIRSLPDFEKGNWSTSTSKLIAFLFGVRGFTQHPTPRQTDMLHPTLTTQHHTLCSQACVNTDSFYAMLVYTVDDCLLHFALTRARTAPCMHTGERSLHL